VPTDLADLLRSTAAPFEARAKSLMLEIPSLPPVELHPVLLRRAFANLLDNAIKYGGGDIHVHVRLSESELFITVADSGAGIDAAHREAVKRPFVRLNAARSDAGGAGLGLAIVERAARLHGGRFELQTAHAGGLAAVLALPLRR
jgi:two-component system osmolarity sensor histidine kinase EnvZ